MASKRRRSNSEISISLFSFQDIITCLSGIMILLVLLIAVDIVTGKLTDKLQKRPLAPVAQNSTELLASAIINSGLNDKNSETAKNRDNILKREVESLREDKINYEQMLSDHYVRQKELKELVAQLKKKKQYALMQNTDISFILRKDNNINHQRALIIECSGKTIRSGMMNDNLADIASSREPDIFSTDQNGIDNFIKYLSALNRSGQYPVFIIKPSASYYAMQLIDKVKSMGFDVGYDAMVEEESVSFGKMLQ